MASSPDWPTSGWSRRRSSTRSPCWPGSSGAPAAIITGEIKDAILLIHYTGVGRAFRGRNLGLLLKQAAHLQAAAAGATRSYTTNEAANAGIRHVNAKLGYQVVGGDYRIRRAR